jgi:protein O-mannosyl-transferase
LLLALITLVVYLPVSRHDFLNYDDDVYVTENPAVLDGLIREGVRWAFTTEYRGRAVGFK